MLLCEDTAFNINLISTTVAKGNWRQWIHEKIMVRAPQGSQSQWEAQKDSPLLIVTGWSGDQHQQQDGRDCEMPVSARPIQRADQNLILGWSLYTWTSQKHWSTHDWAENKEPSYSSVVASAHPTCQRHCGIRFQVIYEPRPTQETNQHYHFHKLQPPVLDHLTRHRRVHTLYLALC